MPSLFVEVSNVAPTMALLFPPVVSLSCTVPQGEREVRFCCVATPPGTETPKPSSASETIDIRHESGEYRRKKIAHVDEEIHYISQFDERTIRY